LLYLIEIWLNKIYFKKFKNCCVFFILFYIFIHLAVHKWRPSKIDIFRSLFIIKIYFKNFISNRVSRRSPNDFLQNQLFLKNSPAQGQASLEIFGLDWVQTLRPIQDTKIFLKKLSECTRYFNIIVLTDLFPWLYYIPL